MAAELQNPCATHVEFSLNERDAELVGFFEREESIREFAWRLTLARIGDCDAGIAVLNFHSGSSNRDASCNIAPLFIVPCADLPTVNAASIPTFKKTRNCFPNTLRGGL